MVSTIHSATKVHRIACIPGDGIGIEITDAAIQVLNALQKTLGVSSSAAMHGIRSL